MTCVFDGLRKALDFESKITTPRFVEWLKMRNTPTIDVRVNGEACTQKQLEEGFERISCIDKIEQGYWCSTCDPLLMLICQLFTVDITHLFLGKYKICYTNRKNTAGKTINVASDTGHFWAK